MVIYEFTITAKQELPFDVLQNRAMKAVKGELEMLVTLGLFPTIPAQEVYLIKITQDNKTSEFQYHFEVREINI